MDNLWTFLKSTDQSIKSSVIIRIIIISILILLLLIPAGMVNNLIKERKSRRQEVINEINSKWALGQTLLGPVLDIPYNSYAITKVIDKNGIEKEKIIKEVKHAYFLPDKLIINGEVFPEYRKRGIYSTIVYTSDLNISGNYSFPDFEQWKISPNNILWDDAVIYFGITDMRGINKTIDMKWNNLQLSLMPGIKQNPIVKKGVYSPVIIKKQIKSIQAFEIKLNLRGSTSLSFLPIGKTTQVQIKSDWPSPSFNGAFLPKERTLSDNGFNAKWEIFDYNREFPQSWTDNIISVNDTEFGVELFLPVDEYQKTERSTKYAILFIILTFAAVFILFEILNKNRVHPIQYLLVGFSLTIFYLLLISLSEHIPFNWSYLISSLSIVVIISIYGKSICKKNTLTLIFTSVLISLYGFLFFTLQLEDYSLLVGSIGLFIILSIIMIFTRKINWYNFKLNKIESKQ